MQRIKEINEVCRKRHFDGYETMRFREGAEWADAHSAKWISVKDRLPDWDERVLAIGDKGRMEVVTALMYEELVEEFTGVTCGDFNLTGVTHWQPLPPEP